MNTLRILLAVLVVTLGASHGRAASFTAPITGTGGSSSVTTGSVTALAPLILSGTEVQLPQSISQLNTIRALTNAANKNFGMQAGTLYSKNLSLNSRWVYYDDFNENMVTPGLLPDAPTGHKYTLLTQYGNTNHIVQTNGAYPAITGGTTAVTGVPYGLNSLGQQRALL